MTVGLVCQGNIGRTSPQNLLDLQDPPSYSSTTIFTNSKRILKERLFLRWDDWTPAAITGVEAKIHRLSVCVTERAELCYRSNST